MRCDTVKINADNEQGFIIVDADKIPEGATIYGETHDASVSTAKRGRKKAE